MEQVIPVKLILARIALVEQFIYTQSTRTSVQEWLEDHEWRFLGGRWANLEFPNPCFTWTIRQAVRIQVLRALIAKFGRRPIPADGWLSLLKEVAK